MLKLYVLEMGLFVKHVSMIDMCDGADKFSEKCIGKKFDVGKPRYELIPCRALANVVDVLTFGAVKYGDENWRFVSNAKLRYIGAAFRHIMAWKMGEKYDSETGKSHLSHAICCLMFIDEIETIENKSDYS